MIARVLPDLPAIEKTFDYLVPDAVRDQVRVGTIVRVDLHGRRVRGWVVEVPGGSEVDVAKLKPLAKVSSQGPPAGVVDLAAWAAHRWAGRWVHLLRTASPPANTHSFFGSVLPDEAVACQRTGGGVAVVRIAPTVDRLPLVLDAVAGADGRAIVVVPEVETAGRLAARLRRDGRNVALLAGDVSLRDWDAARRGDAVVVGTRIAVWAPAPDGWLRAVVVLDEHDEAMQSEQAPTWHARDVAVERAAREGATCTLVSPVPTLHALEAGELTVAPGERGGWPILEVADRRDEDPVRVGPFSPALLRHVEAGRRVVCVVNRLGRSRLLACTACGSIAACERCGSHVTQADAGELACPACGASRPAVCIGCGGTRFKNLRMGVTRLREELEVLAREPVDDVGASRVSIGTEAILHGLPASSADVVAFLDFDQELLAPRFRAAEQAMVLLARAARLVGPRSKGGRILVQTRQPDHPVVAAAAAGDPGRLVDAERDRRRLLRQPPFAALAVVSGAGAPEWAAAAPDVLGVELLGPADDRWLVRADDPESLADYLELVPRPAARVRIEVDPPRL